MEETINITTDNEGIIYSAKMLKLKAGFSELGFKNFPSDYIAEVCPETKPKKIGLWMRKASNVWHLRSSDYEFFKRFELALENALEKLRNE